MKIKPKLKDHTKCMLYDHVHKLYVFQWIDSELPGDQVKKVLQSV